MRNVVTLLIALTLFCGLAERSQASTFPWPNLVTNPVVASELAPDVASAMAYWKARGISSSSSCTVQAWWVDAIHVTNVVGMGGGCDVALRRTDLNGMPHTPIEQWNIIVHETGHTLNLQHDDPRFPIMGAKPSLETVPLSEKVTVVVPVPQVAKVTKPKKAKKVKKAVKRCGRKHQHKRHRKHKCKHRSIRNRK